MNNNGLSEEEVKNIVIYMEQMKLLKQKVIRFKATVNVAWRPDD